jgi:Glu-tRNA(Gln) amidotransferase subunit E-like FAD-binding protein
VFAVFAVFRLNSIILVVNSKRQTAMTDQYTIMEKVSTHKKNEIRAIFTFSGTISFPEVWKYIDEVITKGVDATANAELDRGTTIFQAIRKHWRVGVRSGHDPRLVIHLFWHISL